MNEKFRPSSSDRWAVCQISLLPYDGPSCCESLPYAQNGTAMHAAGKEAISQRVDPIEFILEGRDFANIPFTIAMAESVSVYSSAVQQLIDQGYEFYLEQHVSAPLIHEDC